MLAYKALYKKMMDDLKDAGMWIDWAEQLMEENPTVAKFLMESAKERLEESFSKTYEHFEEMCEETHGKGEVCMNDVVYDHMMDWCYSMKRKIEHMEKDWGEPKHK
jgi:hypothetical protein